LDAYRPKLPLMPERSEGDRKANEGDEAGRESSVLLHLVQRLKSQPLLLAVAVLLILASVATASVEGLRAMLPWALAIFAVAIVAWVVVELARFRRHSSGAEAGKVQVSAKRVGQTGEVYGVDDESGASATGSSSVNIKAEDVQGRVVGVRRGPRRP